MQTWLVLMRRPGDLIRELGLARFLSIQLGPGGAILAPILHGPLFLFVLAALLFDGVTLGSSGLWLLQMGILVGLLSDMLAPGRWSVSRLEAMATRPLYWSLHTLAAFQALFELAYKPYFWAKTPHEPHQE